MTKASLVAKNMSKPWYNDKEEKKTITSTEYDKLIHHISQAVNLLSCLATKLPSSPAAKLQLLHIQAAKLSNCQAAAVAHPGKQPSCPLAACPPCRPCLVTLHRSFNMHKNVGKT